MNLSNIKNTIIIGTAQLGVNYGIANKEKEFVSIKKIDLLNLCYENSLNNFDTAFSYRNSHKIIGKWIKNYDVEPFINTKIPNLDKSKNKDINTLFNKSIQDLNLLKINYLFLHNANDWNKIEIKKFVDKILNKKLIKKFGLSIYEENKILIDPKIKVIQAPGNIFNQQILLSEKINEFIKNKGEVQIRSVLIQGLLNIEPSSLPLNLQDTKEGLLFFRNTAKELNISIIHLAILCINYIHPNAKLIIGIDNSKQFKDLLDIQKVKIKKTDIIEILKKCRTFSGDQWDPRNW